MPPSLIENPTDEMGNLQSSFRIGKNALLEGTAANDAQGSHIVNNIEENSTTGTKRVNKKRRRSPPRPELTTQPRPKASPGETFSSSDLINVDISQAGGDLTIGGLTSANTPEISSECTGRKVNVTTGPAASCASSLSSVKVGRASNKKLCPPKFRCAGCQGDVREGPIGGSENDEGKCGHQTKVVIRCLSPRCQAPQYHVSNIKQARASSYAS